MIFNNRQRLALVEDVADSDEVLKMSAAPLHSARIAEITANVPLSQMPFPVLDTSFGIQKNGHKAVPQSEISDGEKTIYNGAVSGASESAEKATSAEVLAARTLELMEKMGAEIAVLRDETRQLHETVRHLSNQQSVQRSVFDALHKELADYKNDFVGARMKPVISTMLFLGDAMASFQKEVEGLVDPPDWLGSKVLSKKLVDSNLVHFQEQLDETMRMCEVERIEVVVGEVADARTQRCVAVEPTDDGSLDNCVHKVVRQGWKQGCRTFRPTEVTVWKLKS